MCASPAQIAANRRNSLRSKGPTSEEGRRRSSQNAIKHGLTARVTTVLSSEDAAAFDEQMTGVVRTLNPRNPIEAMLARQAGQSAWMHDRAVRSQTARLSENIEDAEVRETEEVFRLGELLFRTGDVPTVAYGSTPFLHLAPRACDSAESDGFDEPAKVVRALSRTFEGCQWMLARWSELRALLEPGKVWQSHHKLRAIRLLGRHPHDAAIDRDVADLLVGSWSINPKRGSSLSEVRSDLNRYEYKQFVRSVRGTWTDMKDDFQQEHWRSVLVTVVDARSSG